MLPTCVWSLFRVNRFAFLRIFLKCPMLSISVCPSIFLFPSNYLCLYVSIYLCIYVSMYFSICLPIYPKNETQDAQPENTNPKSETRKRNPESWNPFESDFWDGSADRNSCQQCEHIHCVITPCAGHENDTVQPYTICHALYCRAGTVPFDAKHKYLGLPVYTAAFKVTPEVYCFRALHLGSVVAWSVIHVSINKSQAKHYEISI